MMVAPSLHLVSKHDKQQHSPGDRHLHAGSMQSRRYLTRRIGRHPQNGMHLSEIGAKF